MALLLLVEHIDCPFPLLQLQTASCYPSCISWKKLLKVYIPWAEWLLLGSFFCRISPHVKMPQKISQLVSPSAHSCCLPTHICLLVALLGISFVVLPSSLASFMLLQASLINLIAYLTPWKHPLLHKFRINALVLGTWVAS